MTSAQRPAPSAPVHVVAGAVFDSCGRVLVAQRPPGKHLAGGWEFPGGKLAPGEGRYDGLVRELREELGIVVTAAEPLIAYCHSYPDRDVHLDLWRVVSYQHQPRPLDGQALQWVALGQLGSVALVDADGPMVQALQRLRISASG
jgi:8-oxo-dGTP diphosphatase